MNDQIILTAGTGGAAIAAGTDADLYLANPHSYPVQVERVYIVANAALTANDTNYTTLTLKNGSTSLITARPTTVAGTGFTAGEVESQAVLAAAGADLVIEPGAAIVFEKTDSGSGVAFNGAVVVSCRPVRAA